MKRGGFGPRATPLVAHKGLVAKGGPTRRKGLDAGAPLRSVPRQAAPGTGEATPQQRKRRLQLATWAEVRKVALERDDHTCVGCGKPAESVHHRAFKGAGGSRLLDVVENAVSLCGRDNVTGCHGLSHRYKNTQAAARGLSVPRGSDYAAWPVEYCQALGGGLWLLTPDGERVAA